jgi:hypothetical protein
MTHKTACWESYNQVNPQKFRLAIHLLPFLNKTVELMFGATFQGGKFQVEFR